MKNRSILILLVLMMSLMLVACSSDESTPESTTQTETESETESNTASETETETVADTTQADEALPVFSAEELSKYNGKDGKAAYVAYEGKVYDVSNIAAWKNGIHQNQFEAGKDFTDILNNQAPHSPDNLTKNAKSITFFTTHLFYIFLSATEFNQLNNTPC